MKINQSTTTTNNYYYQSVGVKSLFREAIITDQDQLTVAAQTGSLVFYNWAKPVAHKGPRRRDSLDCEIEKRTEQQW